MSTYHEVCHNVRQEIITIFEKGGRGHLPSAFSLVEILVAIYYEHSDITPDNYESNNKVLLSKGHGCLALYAILGLRGFFEKEEYNLFCKVGGKLGGHPTRNKLPGIEISSGSLGHGASIAVGRALALKLKGSDQKIFVILGDGECNEGSVWEAFLSARKNNLNNIVFIIDYNKQQSYGDTQEVCPLEPLRDKLESFLGSVEEVDMTSKPQELQHLLDKKSTTPKAIICHTIKGQGSTILAKNLEWHHKNKVSDKEIEALRESVQ